MLTLDSLEAQLPNRCGERGGEGGERETRGVQEERGAIWEGTDENEGRTERENERPRREKEKTEGGTEGRRTEGRMEKKQVPVREREECRDRGIETEIIRTKQRTG